MQTPNRDRSQLLVDVLDVLVAALRASPDLRQRQWRVLVACLVLIVRAGEYRVPVRTGEVGGLAGVADSRDLGRELRSLSERSLLEYTPGCGRSKLSQVGLPRSTERPQDEETPGEATPGITPTPPKPSEGLMKTLEGLRENPVGLTPGETPRPSTPAPAPQPRRRLPRVHRSEEQDVAAREMLDLVKARLCADYPDGATQAQQLELGMANLDDVDRLCVMLARLNDDACRSHTVDRLSASYATANNPAAAFYKRTVVTVRHFEERGMLGDGYATTAEAGR
jgi:hypothetical protein